VSTGITKDGRWYCHYRDLTGKGCREYFGRGDEAKNAAETRDLEVRLVKKKPPSDPVRLELGTPTFAELAQDYVNHRAQELAPTTMLEIVSTLNHDALPVMGHKRAGAIGMKDLTDLEKKILDRRVRTQTVNRRVGYVSKIFAWARARQIIASNSPPSTSSGRSWPTPPITCAGRWRSNTTPACGPAEPNCST
jgi:hypothetical protein